MRKLNINYVPERQNYYIFYKLFMFYAKINLCSRQTGDKEIYLDKEKYWVG